jgi:hypothetical protein
MLLAVVARAERHFPGCDFSPFQLRLLGGCERAFALAPASIESPSAASMFFPTHKLPFRGAARRGAAFLY